MELSAAIRITSNADNHTANRRMITLKFWQRVAFRVGVVCSSRRGRLLRRSKASEVYTRMDGYSDESVREWRKAGGSCAVLVVLRVQVPTTSEQLPLPNQFSC